MVWGPQSTHRIKDAIHTNHGFFSVHEAIENASGFSNGLCQHTDWTFAAESSHTLGGAGVFHLGRSNVSCWLRQASCPLSSPLKLGKKRHLQFQLCHRQEYYQLLKNQSHQATMELCVGSAGGQFSTSSDTKTKWFVLHVPRISVLQPGWLTYLKQWLESFATLFPPSTTLWTECRCQVTSAQGVQLSHFIPIDQLHDQAMRPVTGRHRSQSPLVGGFNQPIWKICASQIGTFPQVMGESKK